MKPPGKATSTSKWLCAFRAIRTQQRTLGKTIVIACAITAWAHAPSHGDTATPIPRLITDTQGRSLDGVILAKDDEKIQFQRKSDGTQFAIRIETLSDEDKIFLSGIENWEQAPKENQRETQEPQHARFPTINTQEKVFLGLPFIPQERGGICVSACLANVLQFLDPKLEITQEEANQLLNRGRSGATGDEIVTALHYFNYQSTYRSLSDKNQDALLPAIKQSLRNGVPVFGGLRRHMVLIVGWDEKQKEFILWDQASNRTPPDANTPPGTFTVPEHRLHSRLISVVILDPKPDAGGKILGHMPSLLENRGHTLVTTYSLRCNRLGGDSTLSDKEIEAYLRHALEPRFNVELRKGYAIVLQTNNPTEFIQIQQDADEGLESWKITNMPSGEPVSMNRIQIIRSILERKGEFTVTIPPKKEKQ